MLRVRHNFKSGYDRVLDDDVTIGRKKAGWMVGEDGRHGKIVGGLDITNILSWW